MHTWETVPGDTALDYTERMEVPSGWIYRNVVYMAGTTKFITTVFVPFPPTIKIDDLTPEKKPFSLSPGYTTFKVPDAPR